MAIQGFFTGDVKIKDLNGVLKAVDGIVEVATDAGTVTSVGIQLGSTGTDANVANSPITSSGNITLNLPTASATNRGLLSSADWTTFNNKQAAGNYVTLDTFQTITASKVFSVGFSIASAGGTNQPTFFENTNNLHSGSVGSNIFGFNTANNIFFGKGSDNGGVLSWNNSEVRYYTLPNANGTIALVGGSGVGTVTSIATTGPITGGTITSTGTIGITQATTSTDGYLSSTDWNTFNNKQGALTLTTTGSSGAATLIGTTLNIPNYSGALSGYVPYTGATANVDLGEYELKAGQLTLDVSPTGTAAVGTTRWNNTIGSSETTLKGGNVILKNGVDLVARVVNKVTPNTTLTKANYPAVRVSGAAGQRLAVAYAQANNDNNSADTIGLVTETIATNQEGFIMTVGQLLDINTTGSLQGETWADGDVLYLSPTTPGALTNVKPNGSTGHIVVMGYVEYAHANHGSIYVKVMNGWELDELHNVYISSVVNNQGLFYESSTQLWKNKSIATVLGYTPANAATTITINGTTYDISTNRTWSVGTVTSIGTSGPITGGTITGSGTIGITQATTSTDGYLSSTDWNTFNSKQASGSYITALTGEATASGPGSATVTLSTSAVTGKLLTGLNLTGGGSIAATDSILQAFGKVQNQISGLAGGVTYQGTWNASTNTPTLTSSVGTKGYYYIVDVAGSTNLNGITDWKVGDWAIFNGSTWDKVDNTDAVSSVNGFTGAVSLTTSNIAEGTNLYYLDSRARLALSFTAGSGAYDNTTGVITIPTNTSQLTNGANFITLSSLSASSPLAYNSGTGAFSIQVATGSQNGYLSSTDWTTFNSKQPAGNYVTTDTTQTITALKTFTAKVVINTGGTDDQLQLVGTAPSVRLTNAATGATINGFIAMSGGANNYIQGSVSGDMTIGNQNNGKILFGFGSGTATQKMSLDSSGNAVLSGGLTLGSTLSNGTYTYTLPGATGTLALTSQIPSNPVGGTGTTNYVSKFTGTSTIGNSLIYDNGSVVAIGTTVTGFNAYGLPLVVGSGSGNQGITVYSGSTSFGSLHFAYGTTGDQSYRGGFEYSHSDNQLNVLAGAGVRMIVGVNQVIIPFNGSHSAGSENFYVQGTGKLTGALSVGGQLTLSSTITNGTYTYTLPSATGTLALTSQIPANPVGGTGTVNDIAKFTAAGVIGDSNIIDTGTLITLGSTSLLQNSIVGTISTFRSATANGQRLDVNSTATGIRLLSGFDTGITGTFEIFASGGSSTLIFGTQSTERMRIGSGGEVGIGSTSLTGYTLRLGKNIAGSANPTGLLAGGIIQADATGTVVLIGTSLNTVASLNTSSVYHYNTGLGSIGAGTTIGTLYGYVASGLTQGTTNYGFFGNLSAATGRWNLYMNGTAANYLAGNLRIGSTSTDGTSLLEVAGNARINVSNNSSPSLTNIPNSSLVSAEIQGSNATNNGAIGAIVSNAFGNSVRVGLNLRRVVAGDVGSAGAGTSILFDAESNVSNTIANQALISAFWQQVPAAGNENGSLTFSTALAGTLSEKMRIDAIGSVGIGSTSLAGMSLRVSKNITGATTSFGIVSDGQIQSSVTNIANVFSSNPSTQAATFNLGALVHYNATLSSIGAGNTINNQFGFLAENTLVGATNNFGFYGNIPSGTNRWNLYMAGTAANYLNGDTSIGTTTGGFKLNVGGTLNVTGAATFSSTVSATQFFADVTSGINQLVLKTGGIDRGYIQASNASLILNTLTGNDMQFHSNSTERMRLTASGELCVGRTSAYGAGFLLNVQGNIYASAAIVAGSSITSISNTNGQIAISPSTNTNAAAFVASNAGGGCYFGKNNSTGGAFTGTAYATVVYSGGDVPMAFYTNDAERMRITSGGNVGIGTTTVDAKLDVYADSGNNIYLSTVSKSSVNIAAQKKGVGYTTLDIEAQEIRMFTATSERMRITSGGNVGIGTTAPSSILHLYKASEPEVYYQSSAATWRTGLNSDNDFYVYTANSKSFYVSTNGSERMRITSGGMVLVNTTSIGSYGSALKVATLDGSNIFELNQTGTSNSYFAIFTNGNGAIGSITTNGTSTAYNTTSDYRLKQDLKDFSGLDLVNKIKTYDYEWKADKSRSYGVIAHELQSVINYAVTGVKDGEKMQGVDYSKIVPVLIKAIQESHTIIKTLEERIVNLEHK